jgi:xanthine dehydrogenase YagR molybdenum-binding subunit
MLNVRADQLECVNGTVRVKNNPAKSLSWTKACSNLGVMPITVRGRNPDTSKPPDLTGSGVGGVQMAEVEVDTDTGVVKVKKMVAVQDLRPDHRPAAGSQCLGERMLDLSGVSGGGTSQTPFG